MTDDELDALCRAYELKDESRTGWQLRGITDPESVAAHTWGVAFLCLVYGDRLATEFAADDRFEDRAEPLDVDRAVRLAVLHDLAEAETGDLPTRADPAAETVASEEKTKLERAAIDELTDPLQTAGLTAAWNEYEERNSPEAIAVKEMDLIDMCLQALLYEREKRYDPDADAGAFEAYDNLDEFFATAEPRLQTDLGRSLFSAIRTRYREEVASR